MNWVEFLKPVVAMLVFDTLFALMTALVKKALADGLNHVVFITLRQFVAAVLLAPIAYFKERFVTSSLISSVLSGSEFLVQSLFMMMFSTW
jgi:hypothetical protein